MVKRTTNSNAVSLLVGTIGIAVVAIVAPDFVIGLDHLRIIALGLVHYLSF